MWLTRTDAWRIDTPLLMLATVLVAQGLALLLLRMTRLRAASIALLANVPIGTFAFQLVTWRFGLAQLLGMAFVPVGLLLVVHLARETSRRGMLRLLPLPLLLAGLLVTFPHLGVFTPPVIGLIALVGALLGRDGTSALRSSGVLVGGLLLAAVLVPTRLPGVFNHVCELAARLGGWPVAGILPTGLVGFQTGFTATAAAGALFASAWLMGEALSASLHLRRRTTVNA
jgi:hypothetical protein